MKRPVYRCLDRPATFFGIRGRFMLIMVPGLLLSLILGLIIGGMTSMLMGFGVILTVLIIFYFITVSLQSKIEEKDIWKIVMKLSYPDVYRMKPKHIRNIWKGFNLPNTNLLNT